MEYRHPLPTSQTVAGIDFAAPVAERGYAWWYLDAWSDCGRHGLTIIAMLGCVFSPWYAAARRRGAVDPLAHSGLNVALYGDAGHRWALTERGAADVQRGPGSLGIGPSALVAHDDGLVVRIDEVTSPLPRRLKGTVRLRFDALADRLYPLDATGRHRWQPIAPRCRIEAAFESPALRWEGSAYLDRNEGSAPLEEDFASWNWSRAHRGTDTLVFYDTEWATPGAPDAPQAPGARLALAFDAAARARAIDPPPVQSLSTTPWGIRRATRCDAEARPQVLATLEDGPFYARSRFASQVEGQAVRGFHESVSLRRFAARWVQCLLPVRLPRRPLRRSRAEPSTGSSGR
jgi:carotenoid 1,2-hydratase